MAKYTIECDICMGFTHYGAVVYNRLNADVDMDASDHEYEVHIPKEIIEMAKQPDTDKK